MTTETTPPLIVPGAPAIPDLRFRPFDPGRDYPALVGLLAACHLADGIEWIPSEDGLRNDYEHSSDFDPARDVLLAEVGGGLVAAAERQFVVQDGTPVHFTIGWVLPAWRDRGIGSALLGWTTEQARAIAATRPDDPTHHMASWPEDRQVDAVALLEDAGFGIVRYGFMMLRDLAEPIPDLPLPDGLELRPVVEADHRRIWDADVEAFRDHWGHRERTEEDFVRWYATPELETDRWRVAWDGDEVAGSVMTFVFPEENEKLGVNRGWLEHVSVRRPWRRRGLASALIASAMRGLAADGVAEAALGVDAENVSGALGVYEAIGFRRAKTNVNYRKSLDGAGEA